MDRMIRVNELLKRELSTQIERRVSVDFDCLVTVTGVDTAPDLRHARVSISVYGSPGDAQDVLRYLSHLRSDLQQELNRNVKLKYTPRLTFALDVGQAEADRVVQLLEQIEQEQQGSSEG